MRFLLTVVMLTAFIWSSALVWFLHRMPTQSAPASATTDAIVVLTGGQGRVERGLDMLAQGAAPVLLISGVGQHVTIDIILNEHTSHELRSGIESRGGEIVLDHVARSTVSNADQSAAFIQTRRIRSIRLITASYHMLRSMHEFRAANPELAMIADPVFPEEFRRDEWWEHDNTRRLVFSEFYKYSAVMLRDALRPSV